MAFRSELSMSEGEMPRGTTDPTRTRAIEIEVLHVVGRLTDSVFRFVGPATAALQSKGLTQVVLAFEDPRLPHLAEQFAPGVEVVVLPYSRHPIIRWHSWLNALRHLASHRSVKTLHLHGFIPSVLATRVLYRGGAPTLIYSPHGSRSHQRTSLRNRLASLALRPWVLELPASTVVSLPSDARVLSTESDTQIHLFEVPVDAAYFGAERRPSPSPLVAGGVLDDPEASARRFAQWAVLLGNGDGGTSLEWIAPVTEEIRAHLHAAEIRMHPDVDVAARAARLAQAWVFICPEATHGFPGHLAEAMTCGVPVVAIDHPSHRDLVEDGVTGFLVSSDAEMHVRVLELMRDPALRRRMGAAARTHAEARFSPDQFDSAFSGNYPG